MWFRKKLEELQSRHFVIFWPFTKLLLKWKKPGICSLLRQENTKEIMTNHKGTRMATDYKLPTWNDISANLLKIRNCDLCQVHDQKMCFTWAKSNAYEGEQRIFVIYIRFGSCKVWGLNLALAPLKELFVDWYVILICREMINGCLASYDTWYSPLPEIWDKMAAKHWQYGQNGGKFV